MEEPGVLKLNTRLQAPAGLPNRPSCFSKARWLGLSPSHWLRTTSSWLSGTRPLLAGLAPFLHLWVSIRSFAN